MQIACEIQRRKQQHHRTTAINKHSDTKHPDIPLKIRKSLFINRKQLHKNKNTRKQSQSITQRFEVLMNFAHLYGTNKSI